MSDEVRRQLDAYLSPIAAQLLRDCEVMARHAIGNGLGLPEWLGNALAKIGARTAPLREQLASAEADPSLTPAARAQMLRATENDVAHAVRDDLRALTRIHGVLAERVAPATPRSIAATESADTLTSAMRSIPLLRHMLVVGLVCLLGYLFPWSVLGDAPWWVSAAAQLRLLLAAGLGASFYALFTANRYVVARTYDPGYTIVYWTRLGLGLIAGAILAQLVAPDVKVGVIKDLGPTTVALLGGYASDAVNRILRRLVDMLVTLVRGDTRDLLAAHEREMRLALAEQVGRVRLQTAASLIDLTERLAAQAGGAELKARLKEIVDGLLAGGAETPAAQP